MTIRFPNRFTRAATLLSLLLVSASTLAQTKRPVAPPKPAPKAAAPAAPKKEMSVPFSVGEVLEFDIGWSSYLTAGTATVTVKEKKPSYNSIAYYIVAEGRPTPLVSKLYTLYYKADTLLDAYSLLPQRGSLYSEEGKRHRMKTTTFNQAAKKAKYEVQTATIVKKELTHPRLHAGRAVGALRAALDPDEGRREVQHAGQRHRQHLQGADAGRRGRAGQDRLGTINGARRSCR